MISTPSNFVVVVIVVAAVVHVVVSSLFHIFSLESSLRCSNVRLNYSKSMNTVIKIR